MDIHGFVLAVYAIIVALAVLPLIFFMLHLLVGGGAIQGGWARRTLSCILWSLVTMGAALVGLPDSIVLIAGILPSLVLVILAWRPIITAWRDARETDRKAIVESQIRYMRRRAISMRQHPSNASHDTDVTANTLQYVKVQLTAPQSGQ